jgi:hypothetical protein
VYERLNRALRRQNAEIADAMGCEMDEIDAWQSGEEVGCDGNGGASCGGLVARGWFHIVFGPTSG